MSHKKNKNPNQNVQHESKEQLQEYFSNPNSGEYQNEKLHNKKQI